MSQAQITMTTVHCHGNAMLSIRLLFLTTILGVSGFSMTNDQEHSSSPSSSSSGPKPDYCGCMMGPQGSPGVPGVPGLHGSRGRDGNKGDPGEKGSIGTQGLLGPFGPMGPNGLRGKRGTKGETGDSGGLGPKGDRGDSGPQGPSGTKGQKGDSATPRRKVAFSVARSQKLGPVLQDTPITFDVVFTNLGESFDVYSSHFVCKQNGTYLFTTHVLGQNNKDVYAWIMMNDKHKVPLHGDGRAGYGTGSQTVILTLRVEDHVWIQLSKDSGLLNDYTTFSGYLIFDE